MKRLILAAVAASAVCFSASADTKNVFGTFAIVDGSSHISIADCGDGTPCGRVVWFDPVKLMPGQTAGDAVDAKGNKIMGLTLLKGFSAKSSDWRGGTIYDPEEGKTYNSRLKRLNDGKLEVKGCIGPICQTQIWNPVSPAKSG